MMMNHSNHSSSSGCNLDGMNMMDMDMDMNMNMGGMKASLIIYNLDNVFILLRVHALKKRN